jgi:hypothetical protein
MLVEPERAALTPPSRQKLSWKSISTRARMRLAFPARRPTVLHGPLIESQVETPTHTGYRHATLLHQITEIKVRYRAGYAYIDAVIDGEDDGDLRLCRLKDTGHPDQWGFALFTYSSERHEDNVLPTGLPFGTPEDALDCAAGLYLGDPAPGPT